MRNGYLSRALFAVLYSRCREVNEDLQDQFLELAAQRIRGLLQPSEQDVHDACNWAREKLGIGQEQDPVYKAHRASQRLKAQNKHRAGRLYA